MVAAALCEVDAGRIVEVLLTRGAETIEVEAGRVAVVDVGRVVVAVVVTGRVAVAVVVTGREAAVVVVTGREAAVVVAAGRVAVVVVGRVAVVVVGRVAAVCGLRPDEGTRVPSIRPAPLVRTTRARSLARNVLCERVHRSQQRSTYTTRGQGA